MSKLYYQTPRNYSPRARFEPVEGESQTVPGEAKTVRELMQRALAGIETMPREFVYFDPDDVDFITDVYRPGLDLTDLDHLRELNKQTEAAIQRAQEKKAADEKAAKEKAAADSKSAAAPSDTKDNASKGADKQDS